MIAIISQHPTHALIFSAISFFALLQCCIAAPFDVDYDVSSDEQLLETLEEVAAQPLAFNASFPDPSVLRKIGEISGVFALNSSHIYVFHRAERIWNMDDFDDKNVYTKQNLGPIKKPTIALLVDGKITKEFGEGMFFLPHSITVDHEGNLWTSDVALHQIFKFAKDDFSKPALVLGERFKPGSDDKHFCKPTDVKVSTNGDFFVSDGYCNNRVLKFKADGSLITYWGEDSLNLPHGLALMPELDLILVADRENKRLVAYTACSGKEVGCGRQVREWIMSEPVYSVDVHNDQIYALLGGDQSSFVQVLDFDSVSAEPYGETVEDLGMGHTLSALKREPGFVVGSLVPNCLPEMPCAMSTFRKKDRHGGLYLFQQA